MACGGCCSGCDPKSRADSEPPVPGNNTQPVALVNDTTPPTTGTIYAEVWMTCAGAQVPHRRARFPDVQLCELPPTGQVRLRPLTATPSAGGARHSHVLVLTAGSLHHHRACRCYCRPPWSWSCGHSQAVMPKHRPPCCGLDPWQRQPLPRRLLLLSWLIEPRRGCCACQTQRHRGGCRGLTCAWRSRRRWVTRLAPLGLPVWCQWHQHRHRWLRPWRRHPAEHRSGSPTRS